jgi:hypothetical protein
MDDTSIRDITRAVLRRRDEIYHNRDRRRYGFAAQLDLQAACMSDPLCAQVM